MEYRRKFKWELNSAGLEAKFSMEELEVALQSSKDGGFRKNRSTSDKALLLRELIRQGRESDKQTYVLFLDVKKCYDRVEHSLIEETLAAMSFPARLRGFLKRIYQVNTAEIQLANGEKSEPFTIGIGVKQGCPLSPTILNLILDPIVRCTRERCRILGYVDDLCMVLS
jgi:hypothetical protein